MELLVLIKKGVYTLFFFFSDFLYFKGFTLILCWAFAEMERYEVMIVFFGDWFLKRIGVLKSVSCFLSLFTAIEEGKDLFSEVARSF